MAALQDTLSLHLLCLYGCIVPDNALPYLSAVVLRVHDTADNQLLLRCHCARRVRTYDPLGYCSLAMNVMFVGPNNNNACGLTTMPLVYGKGSQLTSTNSKTLPCGRGDIRCLHAIVQRQVHRDGQGDLPRVA